MVRSVIPRTCRNLSTESRPLPTAELEQQHNIYSHRSADPEDLLKCHLTTVQYYSGIHKEYVSSPPEVPPIAWVVRANLYHPITSVPSIWPTCHPRCRAASSHVRTGNIRPTRGASGHAEASSGTGQKVRGVGGVCNGSASVGCGRGAPNGEIDR